jgi:hypothetical protein
MHGLQQTRDLKSNSALEHQTETKASSSGHPTVEVQRATERSAAHPFTYPVEQETAEQESAYCRYRQCTIMGPNLHQVTAVAAYGGTT